MLSVEGPEQRPRTGGRPRSTSSPTTTGSRTSSWLGALEDDDVVRMPPDRSRRAARGTRRTGSSRRSRCARSSTTGSLPPGRRSRSTHAGSARCSGTSGGVLRVRDPLGEGQRYRVWSYAPDPAPAGARALASALPAACPGATSSSTSRSFPRSAPRAARPSSASCCATPRTRTSRRTGGLYDVAGGVAGSRAEPVRGGARARGVVPAARRLPLRRAAAEVAGPPLVDFVTRTKAGYCQHYAGAMAADAAHARHPARVAVGFTSGTLRRREVDRHRPRRARVGRGLVRGPRLGAVRPDARARDLRRRLHVRVGLARRPSRRSAAAT